MTCKPTMPRIRVRPSYILDKLQDDLEAALRFGLQRAYKHSDATLPEDAQLERIYDEQHREAMGVFHEVFDFGGDDPPHCDCYRDDDDCGVEVGGDDDD